MAPQSIEQQIRLFIVEVFLFGQEADNLTSQDSLLKRGIVDSTGVLEVVSFVERTWNLQVADEELVPDNFESIERIARFVDRKTRSLAQAAHAPA
jgi:acyl carrier protein